MGPELEEASSAAGAGWFDYFSRILLPLLRPTLFSVAIVVFISGIRDIPTVIFLATHESRTLSLLMLDYIAEANSRRQLCCWVSFSLVSSLRFCYSAGFWDFAEPHCASGT
jgi:ABC-type Fe3+ transport system permease subunit